MTLKEYAYTLDGECLSWALGTTLQLLGHSTKDLMNLDMALFYKAALQRAFKHREDSLNPTEWDEMINRRSAEYAYYLNKLENV